MRALRPILVPEARLSFVAAKATRCALLQIFGYGGFPPYGEMGCPDER